MIKTTDAGQRAQQAVANVLPRSAEIQRVDECRLIVNDVPVRVEWVGEGWLRDVKPVLASLDERPDILVARRMSPSAREAIVDAGLSWVDETGAAEIAMTSIVVSRSGRPIQRPRNWTRSVLAVVEALLCDVKGTVEATKQATGLSTGSCASGLSFLQDLGLLEADADRGRFSGRRVADPDRLLDAYASEVAATSSGPGLQIGVTWREPTDGLAQIGMKWKSTGMTWACTGTVAASMLAPHLTSGASADVYVDVDTPAGLVAAAADAGLRPIEGGRLTLHPFPTPTTRRLAEQIDSLRIAPWPRVYADLRTTGVRGEQAAEHLREVMRGR